MNIDSDISCNRCKDKGWYWSVPGDFNPFYKGSWETSRAMRRTTCTCSKASDTPPMSAMDRAIEAIMKSGRAA